MTEYDVKCLRSYQLMIKMKVDFHLHLKFKKDGLQSYGIIKWKKKEKRSK